MNGHDPPADGPTGTFPDGRSPPVEPPTPPYVPGGAGGDDDRPPPSARFRPHTLHKEGGMGRVHRAADGELNREVSFKDIRPRYADSEAARQRFVFEAEVTARLEHPGIVPVYGFGRCPAGRPYYGMRFIDGQTVGEAAADLHAAADADRALSLRRLLTRFVSVCQTVAFAHSRGVIHRDLKPANILLGPFGETLVLDWGIAKRLRAAAGEAETAAELTGEANADPTGPTRSAPGSEIGTPGYWAPEQAAGRPDRHDERTDVYGLGAVLFHILTGQPPHPNGTHPPDPPSPRAVRPWVDERLDEIARRALAHAQEDRFPSAEAVAAEVERWLADQPVAAQQAAVAALADQAGAHPDDFFLAEQLARQRSNLGLMLGGMGRNADATAELAAAAAMFSRLASQRTEPRLSAEEANCYLALARSLAAAGRAADAAAAERMAVDIYRGLIAARPDEFRANHASIVLTWAGRPPAKAPADPPESGGPAPPEGADTGPQTLQPPDPSPPPDPGTVTSDPSEERPATRDAGLDLTDGYTPIRELGRGGMSLVLLATDNVLDRKVAIKLVPDHFGERTNQRFLRELRVTAALEHPNVVRVYGHGRRASTGQLFLVLEYLPGEGLAARGGRLGPGWSAAHLDPLAQVCDALHYAHSRGVVHRDPKLTNVMVLPSGRAVLFDWGLAKVVGVPDVQARGGADPPLIPDAADLTHDGAVMGTPAYMAPEQARGELSAIGPRTDVYVVGAGLFRLLTGRHSQEYGSGGAMETVGRVARGDIPRPRDVRPDVPPALDAVCAKAMAFLPGDRYPTAAALAADLRAYLAGRPVSVAPWRGLWGWLTGGRT
jgi:serine/threonine protein kinase